MTTVEDRDQVLVGMKTAFMRRGLTALLPGRFTLDETLKHLRQTPAKDPDTAEVLQQLEVETAGGEYHFLTSSRNGESKRATPSTRLHEIATPREIKTARGVEVVPAAAVEVQGYARVGGKDRSLLHPAGADETLGINAHLDQEPAIPGRARSPLRAELGGQRSARSTWLRFMEGVAP